MQNASDPDHFAALMIGDLALRLHAAFSGDGTGAYNSDLPDDAFAPYGITCTYEHSYNSTTVYQNLLDSLPVIFGGHRYENVFSWPGHSFVIDGFDNYVTTTHYVYTWVYDFIPEPGQGNVMLPLPPDNYEETVTSTSPILRYFYLNWGYGDNNDDNEYAPDGDWAYEDRTPYQYNKDMTYGFSEF